MKVSIRNVIAVSAGIAALSFGASSWAGGLSETRVTAEGVRTVTVDYSDLDLSDTEGQMTLQYRVKSAARQVCGSSDHRIAGSLALATENKECAERAVEEARYQTGAAQVAVARR